MVHAPIPRQAIPIRVPGRGPGGTSFGLALSLREKIILCTCLSQPASAFRSAGVNGADFLAWRSAAELVADLVVTPFTARKVLACRDKFLAGS